MSQKQNTSDSGHFEGENVPEQLSPELTTSTRSSSDGGIGEKDDTEIGRNGSKRKIHSLVLLDSEMLTSTTAIIDQPKAITTLELSEGENWLQLPSKRRSNDEGDSDDSFLDENKLPRILSSSTATTTATAVTSNNTQQPDFWMLSSTEPSVLEDSALNCFLCFDVDGTYLTIKDMRMISQNENEDDDDDDDENHATDWIVSLRRGTRTNNKNYNNDTATNSPNSTTSKSLQLTNLESLSRRQLRILYHKDCIIIQRSNSDQNLFVLQHQYAVSMTESNESQLSLDNCTSDNENEVIIKHNEKPKEDSSVGSSHSIAMEVDCSSRKEINTKNDEQNLPNESSTDSDYVSNGTKLLYPLNEEGDGINLLTQPTESPSEDLNSTSVPNGNIEALDAPNKSDEVLDEGENSEDDTTVDPDETPQTSTKIKAKLNIDSITLDEKIQQENVKVESASNVHATEKLDEQSKEQIAPVKSRTPTPENKENEFHTITTESSTMKKLDDDSVDDEMKIDTLSSDEIANAGDHVIDEIEDDDDATQDLDSVTMLKDAQSHQSHVNLVSTPPPCEKHSKVKDDSIFEVNNKDVKEDDTLVCTERFSENLLSPSLPPSAKKAVSLTIPDQTASQLKPSNLMTINEEKVVSREISTPIVTIEAIPSKMEVDEDGHETDTDSTRTVDPEEMMDVEMEDKMVNTEKIDEDSPNPIDKVNTKESEESNKVNNNEEKSSADDNIEKNIIQDDVAMENSRITETDIGDTTINECDSNNTKEEVSTQSKPLTIDEEKLDPSKDADKEILAEKNHDILPVKNVIQAVCTQSDECLRSNKESYPPEMVTPHSNCNVGITSNEAPSNNCDTTHADGPQSNCDHLAQSVHLDGKVTKDATDIKLDYSKEGTCAETNSSAAPNTNVQNDNEGELNKLNANPVSAGFNEPKDATINSLLPDNNSCKAGEVKDSTGTDSHDNSTVDQADGSIKHVDAVSSNVQLPAVLVHTDEVKESETNYEKAVKSASNSRPSSGGSGTRRKSIIGPSSVVTSQSFETESGHANEVPQRDTQENETAVSPVAATSRKRMSVIGPGSVVSSKSFDTDSGPISDPPQIGLHVSTASPGAVKSRKRRGSAENTRRSCSPVSAPAPAKRNQKKSKLDNDDNISASEQTEESTSKKRIKNVSLEESDADQVRIIVTGFELNQSQKKKLQNINAVLLNDIEDAHTATHAIVTDGTVPIRRTPKLMIALCRTPNIVTSDWLVQSIKENAALPCEKFLALNDEKAEKLYNFSLDRTIDRIEFNNRNGTFLLSGWSVFFCKGVAGNKAPPEKELRLIIEAADGSWLSSLNSISGNILIITSDPEPKKQISTKDVVAALKNGAIKKTTSWLFHILMTQELDL